MLSCRSQRNISTSVHSLHTVVILSTTDVVLAHNAADEHSLESALKVRHSQSCLFCSALILCCGNSLIVSHAVQRVGLASVKVASVDTVTIPILSRTSSTESDGDALYEGLATVFVCIAIAIIIVSLVIALVSDAVPLRVCFMFLVFSVMQY